VLSKIRTRDLLKAGHEPKPPTGTLRDAVDRLRLHRSRRLRPQFGISSAVGAALLGAPIGLGGGGPAETGTFLLIERNPDAFFVAPNDTAAPGTGIRRYHQHKDVWKPQRRVDFQGGPGRGDVANNAIDLAAAELDSSGLEYSMTRRNSIVAHSNSVLSRPAYANLTRRIRKRPLRPLAAWCD
jgi:hypothetical protein